MTTIKQKNLLLKNLSESIFDEKNTNSKASVNKAFEELFEYLERLNWYRRASTYTGINVLADLLEKIVPILKMIIKC